MRKSLSILLLLLCLALLSTPFSTSVLAQGRGLTLYLYAAKFVCGKSGDNAIVAPGQYFTAINVHNASPVTAVQYIKRFAIALPGEDHRLQRLGRRLSFLGGHSGYARDQNTRVNQNDIES